MSLIPRPWSALLALLFLGSWSSHNRLHGATNHSVVLITVDGFAAYYLNDPKAPLPTLRRLAAEGATADGMRAANPAVTWPNHTTLVTGVRPATHSVLFNGVLRRNGEGLPVAVDPACTQSQLVRVPTLFDRLHAAGYTASEVNWPCTRGATTLEDSFPDVPDQIAHMTPRFREELAAAGWLSGVTDAVFRDLSAASRDQIWTAAASHLIRRRQPNLLLFHMLVTDSLQHKYGPKSPGAYAALALADAQVAEVLRAIDAAGSRDRTTLIVTADHGFAGATRFVSPNVAFRKAGLLEAGKAPAPVRARAQVISEGGVALVYLTSPAHRAEDQAKVIALLGSQEGIERIVLPKEFEGLGFPHPDRLPHMSSLLLVAKEGYAFSNEFRGEEVVSPVTLTVGNLGHHGVLATDPAMRASFIAWGRGIRKGARLPTIDNVDVAPTIARLLGQPLPGAEGRVLTELLE